MRILVVTDKFPPNVVGGAEISLHLALSRLERSDISLHVAALDQPKDAPALSETVDGLAVTRLPGLGQWPPHYPYRSGNQPPLKGLRAKFAWPGSALRYLLTPNGRGPGARLRRLSLFRRLSKAGLQDWMPSFDDDLVAASSTRRALERVIESFDPDIIHADNYRSILTVAASKRRRARFVAMVRDNRFFCAKRDQDTHIDGVACSTCSFQCTQKLAGAHGQDMARLMADIQAYRRRGLSRADRVATTSNYLSRQQNALFPDQSITVVPNPAEDPAQLDKAQRGIAPAVPPEILVVGMVNANKGQQNIVRWTQALLTRHTGDFRFVLAGRGAMLARLRREAQAAGTADRLITLDFLDREALFRSYARARVVLIPSLWPEPFGRVPLEAGLSRRPVVAFGVGGLTESIIDGVTGFVVNPGDEAALVDRLCALLESSELAQRMGNAAREHLARTYGVETTSQGLLALWSSAHTGAD